MISQRMMQARRRLERHIGLRAWMMKSANAEVDGYRLGLMPPVLTFAPHHTHERGEQATDVMIKRRVRRG